MTGRRQTPTERAFGAAVGRELAKRRVERDLSGAALATRSGVSLDTIRSIEIGRVASPGLYAVSRLSTALSLSLDVLVNAGDRAAQEHSTLGAEPSAPDHKATQPSTQPSTGSESGVTS